MDPQQRITVPLTDPYDGISDGAAALAAIRLHLDLTHTASERTAIDPADTVDLEALICATGHRCHYAAVDPDDDVVDIVASSAHLAVRVSRYRLPELGLHTTVWGRERAAVLDELERITAAIPKRPDTNHARGEVDVHVHAGRARWNRQLQLPRWEEIADNYTAAVHADMNRILDRLPPAPQDPRLVVIAGEPGGGKSWLFRALLREGQERGMTTRIAADPGQLTELLPTSLAGLGTGDAHELCLIEDADDLLVPPHGRRSAATSSLLNASDGLVAETLRATWVLTTNLPLGHIDPAMLRPGRTLAAIEVPALTTDEANAWLRRHASSITVNQPTVVARLYELLERPETANRTGTRALGGYA